MLRKCHRRARAGRSRALDSRRGALRRGFCLHHSACIGHNFVEMGPKGRGDFIFSLLTNTLRIHTQFLSHDAVSRKLIFSKEKYLHQLPVVLQ